MANNTAPTDAHLQANLAEQCSTMMWCDGAPHCHTKHDVRNIELYVHRRRVLFPDGEQALEVGAMWEIENGQTTPIGLDIPLHNWEACDGQGARELADALNDAAAVFEHARAALHALHPDTPIEPVK